MKTVYALPVICIVLHYQMIDIKLLTEKYNPKNFETDYKNGSPVPWISFDEFLPTDLVAILKNEVGNIPRHLWTKFTRNGSMFYECTKLNYCPSIRNLVLNLNSSEFITWLEQLTDLKKLIPDPHIIGAGLMKFGNDSSIRLHTDFNWNDQLGLNRALNLILYLSDDWDQSWGGDLEFWSLDRKECVHKIEPQTNKLLIWNYHEKLLHGHSNVIKCPPFKNRIGLRLFYYTSNATPISPPHRSLYWWDNEQGFYDKREYK